MTEIEDLKARVQSLETVVRVLAKTVRAIMPPGFEESWVVADPEVDKPPA